MVTENELNDILLLNLLKADDEKAFKYIFDRYFSPLCRFMYLYVKNQQEVEEMALDIFTYVWENRAGGVLKLKCSLRKVVDCNYDIKKGSYQALYLGIFSKCP